MTKNYNVIYIFLHKEYGDPMTSEDEAEEYGDPMTSEDECSDDEGSEDQDFGDPITSEDEGNSLSKQ